jgi:uncharacterized protein
MMSLISKFSKRLRSLLSPSLDPNLPDLYSDSQSNEVALIPLLKDFAIKPDALEQESLPIPSKPTTQNPKAMAIDFGKLNNVLQNFVSATPDIQGAAIVTPDGLPLASSLPGSLNEERVAAMSAAMLSLGERIASELSRGTTDRIFLEGETGYAILTSCGEDAVFLVMASKAAKQGVLMLEIKQVVTQIKSALERQLSAVA